MNADEKFVVELMVRKVFKNMFGDGPIMCWPCGGTGVGPKVLMSNPPQGKMCENCQGRGHYNAEQYMVNYFKRHPL